MPTLLAAALLALLPGPAVQDQDRIQKLIQDLSDASKDERSKAVEELAKIGRPALDALRKAATSTDLEVKGLANQAIEKIEWVGVEKLKKYAKENLDEGASVEQSKLKNLGRWFQDTRFYEVTTAPPAGNQGQMMVNMGMGTPKSLFAIRKYEDSFYRLSLKGIYSSAALSAFVQKAKIQLPDDDAALDFAVAYVELQAAGSVQNANNWMMTGASRLEKVPDGWALQSGMYGGHIMFRTDKDGMLIGVDPKTGSFAQNQGGDKNAQERQKLEIEKLRLEIEMLKRQSEKK